MLKTKSVQTGTAKSNGAGRRGAHALMRVAFQGDRGAYAESAIARIWRHPVEQIPVPTFTGAVRAVEDGEADACVIPVENSIIGRVEAGWQALAAYPHLQTVAEALVPVRHCLLAPRGATLQGLRSASETPYRTGTAWAQRTLGRIAQTAGELEEAETHLTEALSTFAAMQAHFEVGRTHLSLAVLAQCRGHRGAIVLHLSAAYSLFTSWQVPVYAQHTTQRAQALGLTFTEPAVLTASNPADESATAGPLDGPP